MQSNIYLLNSQKRINEFLKHIIPNPLDQGHDLFTALRYSSIDAGKRIRPALVYATGEALGANLNNLDAPAASVELIHTYSLIHDDLPAMDNDDLRRGKPTCHIKFSESTAILAGDALHSLAIEILADEELNPVNPAIKIKMLKSLAKASFEMVQGQAIDLASENQEISIERLTKLHNLKTGALIRSSVELGALSANINDESLFIELIKFSNLIGLCFQVIDDILDIEGDIEVIGKKPGSDDILGKSTFPKLMGLDAAKRYANQLKDEAIDILKRNNLHNSNLKDIATFFTTRAS